jgi:SAM-dependent methyltransferase
VSLDPYADDELAALYDLSFGDSDYDIAMYENFARRGDTPSLELGIGTGRVALRLARAGLDIVGIDASRAMLARLRSALDGDPALSKRVRFVEADMREFALGERFDLVFCVGNTFQHLLTTSDQIAALRCAAAHLTPGGVFVAKIDSPAAIDWNAGDASLKLEARSVDPGSGETLMRFSARRPIPAIMHVEHTLLYDRVAEDGSIRRRIVDFTFKYTAPDEMRLVMAAAGMRLLHVYGDHDLSPFTNDSDSMIVVGGAGEG